MTLSARDLLAVAIGGAVGCGLRLATDAAIPHADAGFPLSTLLINALGAFVLGLLVARVWPVAPAWLRAGLGTGVLGAFTTFSAVVASLVLMTRAGEVVLALGYLTATLVLGLAAAAAGLSAGRALRRDRDAGATVPVIEADE